MEAVMKLKNAITDIPGILVGHAQDEAALTGCTVILCEKGAVGGVDQRGGAPGTRETDALYPMHLVQQVHAVVLSGGSAFGLESATGVMRYLEEKGVGFDTHYAKVPIVPAAILFDLGIGKSDVRPDAAMGYLACQNARRHGAQERVAFLCGDLFAPLAERPSFDAILSNPPYVRRGDLAGLEPEVRNFEPRLALDAVRTGWTSTAGSRARLLPTWHRKAAWSWRWATARPRR
jgi:hypothetical protein